MAGFLSSLIGPRVPVEELKRHKWRYLTPAAVFAIARVLLVASAFFPYWHMELTAPQYPDGLFLTAYVNHLDGDVREIDGLNHYIGMRPLDEAAMLEKSVAIWAVIAMVLLVEGAAFVHSRWAVLLAIPAITFPAGFVLDLYFWMAKFGQNLDPKAPLSASVKPFTPTVLGEGGIGQFRTFADMGAGLWLAIGCSVLTVVGFYFHRRAYLPLTRQASKIQGAEGACVSA